MADNHHDGVDTRRFHNVCDDFQERGVHITEGNHQQQDREEEFYGQQDICHRGHRQAASFKHVSDALCAAGQH